MDIQKTLSFITSRRNINYKIDKNLLKVTLEANPFRNHFFLFCMQAVC